MVVITLVKLNNYVRIPIAHQHKMASLLMSEVQAFQQTTAFLNLPVSHTFPV